jgi:putative ABC transport system substrate-binding protein
MRRRLAAATAAFALWAVSSTLAADDDAWLVEIPALLHEAAPQPLRLAIIWDPGAPQGEREFYRVWDAARGQGLMPIGVELAAPLELDAALERARGRRAGLLALLSDRLGTDGIARVVAFATQHGLPALGLRREFAVAGGLMSLGRDGALVVNLRTAHALGLTLPPALLRGAETLP